jgi:hypothetical protein
MGVRACVRVRVCSCVYVRVCVFDINMHSISPQNIPCINMIYIMEYGVIVFNATIVQLYRGFSDVCCIEYTSS